MTVACVITNSSVLSVVYLRGRHNAQESNKISFSWLLGKYGEIYPYRFYDTTAKKLSRGRDCTKGGAIIMNKKNYTNPLFQNSITEVQKR